MNTFGTRLRVSLLGESHGAGVGVVLDGVPAGLPIDAAAVQAALDQRRPGRNTLVSSRNEPDAGAVLSGVHRGRATGAPILVWIANQDVDSRSYRDNARLPRPGHADFVNHAWSRGAADLRGGGHASGRLTAGLVAAGAIADGLLAPLGVATAAHLVQVGDVRAPRGATPAAKARRAATADVPTAHRRLAKAMAGEVAAAQRAGDSVGGIVEFVADGVPLGLGDPWMDPLESTIAHLMLAIPAVKGVSFGAGHEAVAMRGSQHNDAYRVRGGKVRLASNHAGGILGGRSTGERLWGACFVKPASSIAAPQRSADTSTGRLQTLRVSGRHDPCIAIRATPVVAACLSIALADAVLLGREQGLDGVWPARGRRRA